MIQQARTHTLYQTGTYGLFLFLYLVNVIGYDLQETWFQKAKKTGKVVISGLIINDKFGIQFSIYKWGGRK